MSVTPSRGRRLLNTTWTPVTTCSGQPSTSPHRGLSVTSASNSPHSESSTVSRPSHISPPAAKASIDSHLATTASPQPHTTDMLRPTTCFSIMPKKHRNPVETPSILCGHRGDTTHDCACASSSSISPACASPVSSSGWDSISIRQHVAPRNRSSLGVRLKLAWTTISSPYLSYKTRLVLAGEKYGCIWLKLTSVRIASPSVLGPCRRSILRPQSSDSSNPDMETKPSPTLMMQNG
mmetsp:Transcript_7885/g.15487  ORF Transcript_7885/g.15487 Transcript_7885/m.15487 type:complete len:236 (-) Transcript_7885:487-1194(-)